MSTVHDDPAVVVGKTYDLLVWLLPKAEMGSGLLRTISLLALACALPGLPAGAQTKPNIVVIMADDLGWADVGYHGSDLRTPNIDRLAQTGIELDQHYVAPMCTPTRAALLTGRYWSRFGNTAPSNTQVLPFDTVTLASALRSRGYQTAIAGKWHLGSKPEWGPRKFGFDRSYGSLAGGVGPWDHRYKRGPYSATWHRNDQLIEEEGHVTDLLAAEAASFIHAGRQGPFFLYVPFTAVHTPLDEPASHLDRNAQIEPARRQYAASVTHLDDAVGQILTALDSTGQRENTLVIFFSDNGGVARNSDSDTSKYPGDYAKGSVLGSNLPLRGRKGQVYEGGIRTPALVNWPETLKPAKVAAPLHVIDWMPTLCRLVGYQPPSSLNWDGRDIWPTLTGEDPRPAPRTLYWKAPRGRASALRSGDWKLVVHEAAPGGQNRRVELFDLAADPNEKRDLAAAEAAKVQKFQEQLAQQAARDDDAVVETVNP